MDNPMFWVVSILAAFIIYRMLSRRTVTPKARVAALLRQYHQLERTGLSEGEALVQLLATRREWRKLPHRFLSEIVSRLRSKEDVLRFISLSEDYGHQRNQYPQVAGRTDLNSAMTEIACTFARFGFELQGEGRFKEAEFVQKLAWRLQPDEYFTSLPLAATYHETGRHAEALPLFEQGFAGIKDFEKTQDPARSAFTPSRCLAPEAELAKLRNRYNKMYQACVKAARR